MKITLVFAVLAVLSMDVVPTSGVLNKYLENIFEAAKLQKKNLQLSNKTCIVHSAFDRERCECEDFYIARETLLPILTKRNKLVRSLYLYTKETKNNTSDAHRTHQHNLTTFVHDIMHCVQVHVHHRRKQCKQGH